MACDSKGILTRDRGDLNEAKKRLAAVTNEEQISGSLADAVPDGTLFIGVSAAKVLTQDMVRSMNKDAIIFAMANPEPEILPDLAKEAGAAVVGTGRSDYPNQINNVLIFPGLFKGALAARAKRITEEMKTAAAYALAEIIPEEELKPDYIIPSAILSECCRHRSRRCGKSLERIERQAESTDYNKYIEMQEKTPES